MVVTAAAWSIGWVRSTHRRIGSDLCREDVMAGEEAQGEFGDGAPFGVKHVGVACLRHGHHLGDGWVATLLLVGRSYCRCRHCSVGFAGDEQQRSVDARVPLHAARKLFATMGAEAFAERAHRELLATGEKIRRWSVETHGSSPRRRPGSRSWPATVSQTPRSAAGSSSAHAQSSTTSTRCSPSSESLRGLSST